MLAFTPGSLEWRNANVMLACRVYFFPTRLRLFLFLFICWLVLVSCWLSGSASGFASVACCLHRSLHCFWFVYHAARRATADQAGKTCFLSKVCRRPVPTPHTRQLERKAPHRACAAFVIVRLSVAHARSQEVTAAPKPQARSQYHPAVHAPLLGSFARVQHTFALRIA